MRRMRARRALAGGAVVAIAVAGCTGESPVEGDPTPRITDTADVEATEAAALRLRLEQQFAMFSAATVAVIREPAAWADAADAAFDQSVKDLSGTIQDAYDRQTAAEFTALANRYPRALQDYGEALDVDTLRSGDAPTAQRRTVMRLPVQMAAYMSTVTGGGMEEDGTAALVRAPTLSLLQVVAAEVERDFQTAYERQREAHAAMVSVGRAFAAGISEQQPDTYPGLRNTGAVELRSALQQLFGEHALLAGDVLRRGLRSARDFDAAAAALNGNTEDLTGALGSIYADDAAQLGVLWRSRISTLAESAVAVAEQRPKMAARLRTELARLDADIADQLQTMSDGAITTAEVTPPLRSMTGGLLQHAGAAASKKLDRANASVAAAHADAAVLAEAVAGGIAEHRPSEFPAR